MQTGSSHLLYMLAAARILALNLAIMITKLARKYWLSCLHLGKVLTCFLYILQIEFYFPSLLVPQYTV